MALIQNQHISGKATIPMINITEEGKNNVKISTEHVHCTSAKEPAAVNPENKIKTNISFEHDYHSSTKENNPNSVNSANEITKKYIIGTCIVFFGPTIWS